MAQMVKSWPAVQETMVLSLGWEDSGEGNGHALHYSRLGIPWIEEPGGLQSMGSQKVGLN